jgi:hypothetical protein
MGWSRLRFLVFLLACSPAIVAQTNTGSITGTVFDQSEAVVNGVRIIATNLATNVTQSAVTNKDGVYSLPALEPGSYRLTLEKSGFKKLERGPITLGSSSTAQLDFNLTVGSASAEVTVNADAPLIQQASSTVQYGTDLKQIDELPLANQSALQILSLLPGVQGDPGVEQAAITTGLTTPGGGLSISGSAMGTVQFQADGVNNTSLYYGRIALSYSTDAVSEVTVAQNSYSAEYRAAGGGIVNMTTKSGTNQLHGTIFSFTQNDILNASPWLKYTQKGLVRYWRGGIDFGGPVRIPKLYNGKNRTFFFFGFEPLRQYTQSQFFDRMATPLERKGDFSQSIYNTITNQPYAIFQHYIAGTNKQIVATAASPYPQFPGNIIPPSMISPIGQKILNLQPLPNMPMNALGQNYSVFRSVRNTDNRINVKLDQVITSNHRVSFRFSEAPTKGIRFNQGGLIEQVPTDRSIGVNSAFSDTFTWGGNKVNELRVGFMRSNNQRTQTDEQLATNGFEQFGFPSYLTRGMPQLTNFGEANIQSFASDVGAYEIDNFLQLTDTLSWTKGKHNLKFGFDVQAPQQNIVDYNNVGGVWSFNQSGTNIGPGNTASVLGIPNATTGAGFATLLLGYPTSVNVAPAVIPYQYRWKYYAGFLQDDFRVTPRLTLNLGVRYQVEIPRSEKHHKQGYFVDQPAALPSGAQQQGYIQLAGLGGAPDTLWSTRYNNLEPRIGFAYRLPRFIKGLQVLRAAYAITHVPTNGLFSSAIPDLSPKSQQLANNGAAGGGQVQMDNFPLVLPTGGFVLPANGKFTDTGSVNALYYLNPEVRMPYVQQWNFGLGFQFGANYGLEVNYVGSKSTNMFGPSQVFNAVNIEEYARQFRAGVNMGQLIPNPAGLRDQNGNIIMVTRQNSLRPYPTLGDITDPLEQGYDARYNALQINLTKRFSRGIQFNVNYTWMKAMDDSSCMGQYCTNQIQNWGTGAPQLLGDSHKLEKSISTFDIPSTFRFNYNWDLPVGRGKRLFGGAHGFVNQIVGNWKLSGNGFARSGLPFQAWANTSAGYPDNVGKLRPNIVPGVDPILPGWKANCDNPVTQTCPYINSVAVFTPPAFLSVGTATRVLDNIRMPHTVGYNMAVLKDFPIHEQVRLAFRAELYGALNHPTFSTNQNNFTLYTGLNYVGVNTPAVTANNINTSYGSVSTNIGGRRTIQLGLKLYF